MKKLVLFLVFVLVFGVSCAWAKQGKRYDPDVQRGYDEHQKWYEQKQKQQQQQQKQQQKQQQQQYEVSGSTDTTGIIEDPLPPGTGDYFRLNGSTDTKSDE